MLHQFDQDIESHRMQKNSGRKDFRDCLVVFLVAIVPANIIGGLLLIVLTLVYDDYLFDILMSLGVFFFVFVVASYCAIKGIDRQIDSAWLKIMDRLCTNLERMIINEKKLRNLDTAFKLLILIEAL